MARTFAFLLALLLASPVQAADQNFKVYLGGLELGWLRYSGSPSNARLSSLFNNTPLGVFDGSYEGSSRASAGKTVYRGKSLSSNKNREVEIIRDKSGAVIETSITPEKDRTKFTDPALVPPAVLDPVAGIGRFLAASTCPEPFKLYDGRRVVQVTPKSSKSSGSTSSCVLDYNVILGQGHLSPLYLKHIAITLEFDPAVAKSGPSLLKMRSGLFGVEFRRD